MVGYSYAATCVNKAINAAGSAANGANFAITSFIDTFPNGLDSNKLKH